MIFICTTQLLVWSVSKALKVIGSSPEHSSASSSCHRGAGAQDRDAAEVTRRGGAADQAAGVAQGQRGFGGARPRMMNIFGGPSRRELQDENERVKVENERVQAESNRLQVRCCVRTAGMMYPG